MSWLVMALAGCGWLGEGTAPESKTEGGAAVDCLALPMGEPEVVVTYTTTVGDGEPVEWIHWRGPTQVGRYYPDRKEAEVWVNSEHTVSMERWYEEDQRVFLQMPQDLAAMKVRVSWDTAGAIGEPALREQFEPMAAPAFRCLQAATYAGQLGAQHHNLTWLPQLGLPGRYEVRGAGPTRVTTLTSIGPSEKLTALRGARRSFEVITTAQLREMGNDPFVLKVRRPGVAARSQEPSP